MVKIRETKACLECGQLWFDFLAPSRVPITSLEMMPKSKARSNLEHSWMWPPDKEMKERKMSGIECHEKSLR